MKNYKIYFLSVCFLTVNISIGQIISCTKVVYKIGKPQEVFNTANPAPPISDMYKGVIKAYDRVECELFYTKEISVFKIVDKVIGDKDISYKLATAAVNGLFYKNLISKEKIKHRDSFGEIVNVMLPFDEYVWAITTESKIISGYKCYKAVTKWEGFDKIRDRPYIFYPEVWFTPEIPASFGPNGLDGLPGLVLEGKITDRVYYYAKTISFDVQEPLATFQKPEKGKYYTVEEYENASAKAFESLNTGRK